MFGKSETSKKHNEFFNEMENAVYEISHLTQMNAEFVEAVQKLHIKIIGTDIDWEADGSARYHLVDLLDIARHAAKTLELKKNLSSEDSNSIQKFFKELDSLYDEALSVKSKEQIMNFSQKISCIKRIFKENTLTICDTAAGRLITDKVFRNYENLWELMHRINTEWEELCFRGFSVKLIYDSFRDFIIYTKYTHAEMSEEEKYRTFMDILDGKANLHFNV